MNPNVVEEFALQAALFEKWARDGTSGGDVAVREALLFLTGLYQIALQLPAHWNECLTDSSDDDLVLDEERRAVGQRCSLFPFKHYSMIFHPHIVPPEEAVIGDIADDVADIFRDVITGLREYQRGREAEAIWDWGFQFQTHWGRHATGAIFALHAWLAENAWEGLNAGR